MLGRTRHSANPEREGRKVNFSKENTMIIFLPLLISLIGVLMYALCTDPKLPTIGIHMFWVGLLAFLLVYHGQPIVVR